jgi:hypothetical protein
MSLSDRRALSPLTIDGVGGGTESHARELTIFADNYTRNAETAKNSKQ